MVFNLTRGTHATLQESVEVGIATPSAAFSDISWARSVSECDFSQTFSVRKSLMLHLHLK